MNTLNKIKWNEVLCSYKQVEYFSIFNLFSRVSANKVNTGDVTTCAKDEETINKRDKRENIRLEVNEHSYFSLSYNNFQRFPDLVPVPISAPDLHIVYAST